MASEDGEREEEDRHGADTAPAPASAQAAMRSGRRQADRNGSRRGPFQMPSASQSRAPPSTAAKSAPTHADAAAGDEIDLDAGFVQRAQHAGVVRAAVPEPVRTSAVRSRVEYGRSGESGVITNRGASRLRRGWS